MRVLVTGATGFVGQRLVPALLDADHDVGVLTRNADNFDGPADVTVIEGDLIDPETYQDTLSNYEVVYYLVHSLPTGDDFAERDRRMAHNFAHAASDAVRRVIYLGGLGDSDDNLSEHLQSRREVELVLSSGEYALTALRAAVIIGEGNTSFEIIRQMTERLPPVATVPFPARARTDCQPIAIDDVIAYLVGVLTVPETAGETFDIGGPEVLTYPDFVQRTASAAGRSVTFVPAVVPSTVMAEWVDLLTDVPAEVAQPLLRGMSTRVVVSETRIHDLVPVDLTPIDTAIEQARSQTDRSQRMERS
jgi:uncharacterized protein YbjT (DUF2867 family)